MEQYLSKISHQNQDSQQFLSCTKTSAQAQGYNNCIPGSSSNNISNNRLWDANHGGEINLQQSVSSSNNNNHIEMQRRRLEDYLPRLSSQGGRSTSVYISLQPMAPSAQSGLPYLNALEGSHPVHWQNDAGVLGCGEDPLSNLSFTDLLTMKDTGLANAAFVSDWYSNHLVNNSTSSNSSPMFFNQMHMSQINGILGGEMQNCGSLNQYQSVCNASSTLRNTNANNSNFASATPYSWRRIDSNIGLENAPLNAYSQAPTKQNEFQEQDVAAATINLQNVVDNVPNIDSSSTDKVSTAVENHGPEKRGDQAIDLNNTPQKKPRRRRYQPKVLSEKKPRKPPKPKTPKPIETSRFKRKYVRKTKVDANTTPTTPPREITEVGEMKPTKVSEVGDIKPPETAAKSCKRSLNFDWNGLAAESSFGHMSNGTAYAEAQGKCDAKINQHNPTDCHMQRVEFVVETSRGGIAAYDLNCALNQELENYFLLPKYYKDNSQPVPNFISNRKQNISHDAGIVSRSDAPHPTQSPNPSPCASSSGRENRRGSKRSNPDVVDVTAGRMDPTLCSFWPSNHAFWGNANMGEAHKFLLSETCKKKRTEEAQRPHVPSTSSVPPVDFSQVASAQTYSRANPSASKYYSCNPATFGIDAMTNNYPPNVSMKSIEKRTHLTNSWADLARLKKERSKGATHVHDVAQLMEIASVLPEKPGPKGPCKKINVSENAYTEGLAAGSISNPRSKQRSMKKKSEDKQLHLVSYNSDRSANKSSGCIPALSWARSTSSVEEITESMKQLDISKGCCNTRLKERKQKKVLQPYHAHKQEQNALVVYGRDGTMVPFNGPFDPIRKNRSAKVDLDDETIKVWKLLQQNIDNKGIDGTDEDKVKWWKNERSVFRGRVDSFIARMRLIQGDRRFTPWKGSVLDSVIGVQLTQNVADHLCSSAFMKLAAHFPLKSEGSKSTLSKESASALVTEPDVFINKTEESISWNERAIIQQVTSCDSKIMHDIDKSDENEVVTSKELNERTQGSVSPKDCCSESSPKKPSSIASNAYSQTTSILGDDRAKDDATSSQHSIMPSQNFTISPHQQTVGTMSIFTDSKSRTQPLTTSSQYNYLDCSTSTSGLLRMEERPFLNESFNQTHQEPFECANYKTKGSPEHRGTGTSNYLFNLNYQFPKGFEMLEVDSKSPNTLRKDKNSTLTEQSNLTTELTMQHFPQGKSSDSIPRPLTEKTSSWYVLEGEIIVNHSESMNDPSNTNASSPNGQTISTSKYTNLSQVNATDITESTMELKRESYKQKEVEQVSAQKHASSRMPDMKNATDGKSSGGKTEKGKNDALDWDSLRREAQSNGHKKERTVNTRDSLDWEAVRHADESEIANLIIKRGMYKMLAGRIKKLLDRLVKEHGSIDMEWLRDISPDKAKEYLLSFEGLGLKSVECVRLLTLHHLAFPVDINVGCVAVRLGWVPLQPLPESLQLHLLDKYPSLESIQKYLWPRLCKLDQRKLYELHYHLITFGKVFCTKSKPNCNACPMRAECRHFASASASARFALPGTEERSNMPTGASTSAHASSQARINFWPLTPTLNEHSQNPRCVGGVPTIEASPSPLVFPLPQTHNHLEKQLKTSNFEPIVEVPASPETEQELEQTSDIEDTLYDDPEDIPTIKLSMKEFSLTRQNCMHTGESNALVALTPEAASIPTPKLKNISRLRTEHHVYELPDTHPLLKGMDKREPDDPISYLLAIWTPGETAYSIQPPERRCNSKDPSTLCNEETCSYCNNLREANSQIVLGTLLIPCRTAMRGSFPLNGTYFQVNEVFADHDSSLNPIPVLRSWLWNLPRRTVYFGTSIPSIFKGLTTEYIHRCFWRGFVCLRGFDQKSRAPRPLVARLHFPASKKKKGAKDTEYDE